MKERQNLLNLCLIFASKTGGILVGIYFLPLFNEVLGSAIFGIVAVILSLQSLLLTLDLGMATLVGRDTAYNKKQNALIMIREAEIVISAMYCFLLPGALLWWSLGEQTISLISLFAILLMFWMLTIQNISFAALYAKQAYKTASLIQFFGVIWRAVFTLVLINNIAATLDIFILAQFIATLINFVVIKLVCTRLFITKHIDKKVKKVEKINFSSCIELANRGKPLVLVSLAGAAVMQLDKSIVAIFMSAEDLVPYFLASAFSMLPIAVLAGPIKQFFQPKIIQAYSLKSKIKLYAQVKNYVIALVTIVVLVTGGIWWFNDSILNLWLQGNKQSKDVEALTKVLLPALAFGAIGYIPYVFIVIAEDYKFQAKFSAIMTIITLIFVTMFAFSKNIYLIAITYLLYHSLSTMGLWYRLYRLPNMKDVALLSAKLFLKAIISNACILAILFLGLHYFI
jgi:O-antigen/teichoic acid export membrane protein